MTETQADTKVSYPYMSSGQWYGVRAKMRQSLPGSVDIDWLMAALGTSEKGARNVLPQLKAIGLIDGTGKPTDLAHDFRDDTDYAKACKEIREALYPETLRASYDDPEADAGDVARWFMRNAGTGELTARNQSKLYLLLLKADLPSGDAPAKRAPSAAKKTPAAKKTTAPAQPAAAKAAAAPAEATHNHTQVSTNPVGPALHIDLQIHISADATDTQIDSIFKSMAKHLYGRE